MAQFPEALQFTLQWENPRGIYSPLPDNKGFQISGINSAEQPLYYSAILATPIGQRAAAVAEAYQNAFWTPMRLGGIADQDVANRVFDEGVNAGAETATRMLQEAVNALTGVPGTPLAVDGDLGPESLSAVNSAPPESLLASFRTLRCQRYRDIAATNPSDTVDLAAWLTRAMA